ncbi:MAG: YicC/YloC family endoribonuclease [Acidobacteriota bacterium]
MIKSMTGFASLSREDEAGTVGVTIRAVNHRYLDLQVRAPQMLAPLEPKLRALVQQRLARGRVELNVSTQVRQAQAPDVQLNDAFVDALSGALEQARARGVISGQLSAGDLVRIPQALIIRERQESTEANSSEPTVFERAILDTVTEALAALDLMRSREGDALGADLENRRSRLQALISDVAAAADTGRAEREQELGERIKEFGAEGMMDPALLAQEIVRFVARSDITEEIVRFRTHLEHWQALVASREPCGRKLDFLLQELNREINTIGSKAEGATTSALVVEVKAELERVREQVQNVE